MRRPLLLTLLALLCLVLVVSRFYPRIERVYVVGARHYTEAEVLRRANIRVGDALLWVTAWKVRGLGDDPWLLGARVIRRWPDTLYLEVSERTPVLAEGATTYALDGTVLPNATAAERAQAVTLKGWGGDQSREALSILHLVAPFKPQVLSYSPSGFTVSFAESSLYTPNSASLREHWSAFVGQQGEHVAVYPWGVSVQ